MRKCPKLALFEKPNDELRSIVASYMEYFLAFGNSRIPHVSDQVIFDRLLYVLEEAKIFRQL